MNQTGLIIFIAVAAVVAAVIAALTRTGKRRRLNITARFGKIPGDHPEFKSIAGYWRTRLKHEDIPNYIDDITWDDLDMDKVFARIDACHTSVGEEYLYSLLREPRFDINALRRRGALIDLFIAHPEFRLDVQTCLEKMGKSDYNGLSAFCYDISTKRLGHPAIYKLLAILPILFVGLFFLSPAAGLIGVVASLLANGLVYYITKHRIERELGAIRYFSAMLWCAGKICKYSAPESHPAFAELAKGYRLFKRLGGKLSGIAQQRVSDVDFLAEYVRVFFLPDILRYNKTIDMLAKNLGAFRSLYQSFGVLDAAIAVASFRKSLPHYTCPEFLTDSRIDMRDIYHPLLFDPVPNTAAITGHTLVSGSNASGKSTFIKAVAVSGILAQTIYTCAARQYKTRPALVITSMAVRDNLTAGESYFITEIKSLRRILQKIPSVFCVCFIDEILKGTNTIERIAASAAVLKYLAPLDCLCVGATHDIELTRMLSYHNVHFSEQITDAGIRFDYIIKDGPSRTKNAIRLLDHLGFDKSIIARAGALVKSFEQSQTWDILE